MTARKPIDPAALRRAIALVRRAHEIRARVDAEVDRRIASHPDLADLDDWLDDNYGDGS